MHMAYMNHNGSITKFIKYPGCADLRPQSGDTIRILGHNILL